MSLAISHVMYHLIQLSTCSSDFNHLLLQNIFTPYIVIVIIE